MLYPKDCEKKKRKIIIERLEVFYELIEDFIKSFKNGRTFLRFLIQKFHF